MPTGHTIVNRISDIFSRFFLKHPLACGAQRAYDSGMTSEEFKAARDRLKMTWQELARALGIGMRTLARYESGERRIPQPVELAVKFLLTRRSK